MVRLYKKILKLCIVVKGYDFRVVDFWQMSDICFMVKLKADEGSDSEERKKVQRLKLCELSIYVKVREF